MKLSANKVNKRLRADTKFFFLKVAKSSYHYKLAKAIFFMNELNELLVN